MSKLERFMPVPAPLKRYYNRSEVQTHNTANDLWVTFFHNVYNLTELVQQHIKQRQVIPLIEAAGTDISKWFDYKTKQPRTRVDPTSGEVVYYCPQGRFLHLPDKPADQDPLLTPWWTKHEDHSIGHLTEKSRWIRIVNVLTEEEACLEVPEEETIDQILTRYESINTHAKSYTWKRHGKELDMGKTLTENGIKDEDREYEELDISESERYIPAIYLYFNDDLTIA